MMLEIKVPEVMGPIKVLHRRFEHFFEIIGVTVKEHVSLNLSELMGMESADFLG